METTIPKALQANQEILFASKMPFIHIEPFETDEILEPWASKYLGVPYLPREVHYPCGTTGKPLALLAQINFSEVPKLEGYPTAGILQFFISDEDLMGLEFTDPYDPSEQFKAQQQQNDFRVIYYPDITKDSNQLITSIDLPDFEPLPVANPCKLEFFLQEQFVGIEDYRFNKVFGAGFLNSLSEEENQEIWDCDAVRSSGNKIGGYAAFIQADVRLLAPPDENWLLLLQIDSADHADIMWGDAGVGNFFIEEKALQALDFSRVLYNWDCA